MKLIFAGTPPFAAAALASLHAAGHEISLVLTQPDRPAGRGLKLAPSAVAELAAKMQLPVAKPANLRDANIRGQLQATHADAMVVAAYGIIMPQAVLDLPALGCLNIHASLLPRWRGAAPVQRAILAGDSETGVGIMQMEAGLDTGPILFERSVSIDPHDTAGSLLEKLTKLGARSIVEALSQLDALVPRAQATDGATYAHKLSRAEAPLDWRRSASNIDRQVRAFNPYPAAETTHSGALIKVWSVLLAAGKGAAGTVLETELGGVLVACGEGAVRLIEVQKPGGKRISAADWARSSAVKQGDVLGA